jgi:hypothetical protein
MAAMGAALLLVSGVAFALSVQCDGTGDQDPDSGECRGTTEDDKITGTAQRDSISARDGLDDVNARRYPLNVLLPSRSLASLAP